MAAELLPHFGQTFFEGRVSLRALRFLVVLIAAGCVAHEKRTENDNGNEVAGSFDQSMRSIAEGLLKDLEPSSDLRIAVSVFHIDGQRAELGDRISDELVPFLIDSRKQLGLARLTLLNRKHVDELLEEKGFALGALVDPTTREKTANLVAATAIITGTIRHHHTTCKVIANLISLNGTVLSSLTVPLPVTQRDCRKSVARDGFPVVGNRTVLRLKNWTMEHTGNIEISVNGEARGLLPPGESRDFELAPGRHQVRGKSGATHWNFSVELRKGWGKERVFTDENHR
jgi:hypothetical protein